MPPVQIAAPALLALRVPAQARIRSRLRDNETWLTTRCAELTGGRLLPREGGWYALLEAWTGNDDEEFCLTLLAEDGVRLQPGYFFDFPRRGCLALSLLTPPDDLRADVEAVLRRLG